MTSFLKTELSSGRLLRLKRYYVASATSPLEGARVRAAGNVSAEKFTPPTEAAVDCVAYGIGYASIASRFLALSGLFPQHLRERSPLLVLAATSISLYSITKIQDGWAK